MVFDVFPHVYPPQTDSFLLLKHLETKNSDTVLELGVGCGLLALCLAKKAKAVVGIDTNPYSVKNALHNASLNGIENVHFINGDLYEPVCQRRFDLIYANPPYVPTPPNWIETDIIESAWNAGANGREILDRILANAKDYLKANGRIVLVQSSLADIDKTMATLEHNGFCVRVLAEEKERLGPISMGRYGWLERQGVLGGDFYERLVVVEGKIENGQEAESSWPKNQSVML